MPGSQIDLRPVRNLDLYVGKKMTFKVIKFNKKRGNIVLSRRSILEAQRENLKSEVLGQIESNSIVKGIVKNITDYGAFVDLGGLDGLLHITDMSWGRVKHPTDILTEGQELELKVLKYDSSKEKISLGLKQMTEDPWIKVSEEFTVGKKVTGKVVNLAEYGAFVEVASGIEGLIHINEMTWGKKLKHPSELLKLDDVIEVAVSEIDNNTRKIKLSLKALEPNPWVELKEKLSTRNCH